MQLGILSKTEQNNTERIMSDMLYHAIKAAFEEGYESAQDELTETRNKLTAMTEQRDEARTELKMWLDGNILQKIHREELEKVERERDEVRKDVIFWRSLAEGRGRTDDGDTGKAMTDHTMKKIYHPLAAKLNNHSLQIFRNCLLYVDIKAAAKLIDDQHDAICKALEAASDGDIKTCIKLLADAANEYPYLTKSEKKN